MIAASNTPFGLAVGAALFALVWLGTPLRHTDDEVRARSWFAYSALALAISAVVALVVGVVW